MRQGRVLQAVGLTAKHRGQLDVAERCLKAAIETYSYALPIYADFLRETGQWEEAAKTYQAAWDDNHDQLVSLYLAGHSLENLGHKAEGRDLKDKASLLALDSRLRRTLAYELAARGLTSEAQEQYRLVLRTAPFGSWQWHDAIRHFGRRAHRQRSGRGGRDDRVFPSG